MVVRTVNGWVAYKDGKRVGSSYPTKHEAEQALDSSLTVVPEGGNYGGKDTK